MATEKRAVNRDSSQPTGKKRKDSRGRARLMTAVAAAGVGSATLSGGAGGVALHLFGTDASVAVIAWGSAVLFVALWVAVVLTWAYVFGDDARSGRVSRLLDRFPGFREPLVPQPAREQVRVHDAPEAWTGLAAGERLVRNRALTTAAARRAQARHRSASSRAVPVVPRQRAAPRDRPPRTGVPRRESRPGRLR
jgi:hypothetical protein